MDQLREALLDARARTLDLVGDLDDAQWLGPRLAIVNPMRWEIGHVAWFHEHWVLRRVRGHAPLRADGDALYDSAKVAHDTRWDLSLPDRNETLAYMRDVLERTCAVLDDGREPYFHRLVVFHEDMHGEALTYTRQTLGYPAPRLRDDAIVAAVTGPWPGDVEIPGGELQLGAQPGTHAFVFDNEKWAHPVQVAPFRMARAPVTNAEFLAFVEDDGYVRDELWSAAGRAWRTKVDAHAPVYWQRRDQQWYVRRYDELVAIPPHHPIVHVCWHEAEAFCRWANRRLPSEAEWELAATAGDGRTFPWGDAAPTSSHANLDARARGPVDVSAHPEGDSAHGCRQLIGNTWEWTSTRFAPYPGFVVDPYKEYSEPWFATPHMVLRGGCWATRARLLRNTWRNFYPPDRRDVLAGFRTCALTNQ
ncbi:MAG TPA: selenoneine synthase SenA [Nannocystaceae bacterium]|nr:selenoneine synthase SenA [Nannocystaceae bacterium]